MAGPLRPRWVMRIFSRKAALAPLQPREFLAEFEVTTASVETPERSHQRA
jgi:hypothetical protein